MRGGLLRVIMKYIYINAVLISFNVFCAEGMVKLRHPQPRYPSQQKICWSIHEAQYAALYLMSIRNQVPVRYILEDYFPSELSSFPPSYLQSQQPTIHKPVAIQAQSKPVPILTSACKSHLPPLTLGGSRPTTTKAFGSLNDYNTASDEIDQKGAVTFLSMRYKNYDK